VPLRRRPQRPRPSDPRRVQPLPGRLRRGKHQHGRSSVACSPMTADKVIVTTIQKLGLALDENSKRNKGREKRGLSTYTDLLEPPARQTHGLHLRRMPPLTVRREPSGHQGILPKGPALRLHRHAHFPRGTQTTSRSRVMSRRSKPPTPFSRSRCTSTRSPTPSATGTSLRFHVDYYKPDGENVPKPGEPLAKARR
jgi:type I restriction enzyme R subunit